MSLLFIHDHRFKKVDNKLYSNGGLNDVALKKYTDIFGKVTVAARVENVESDGNYSEITNKNITVKNTYMDFVAIEELINQNDFIVFRLPSKQGILSIKYAKKYNKPYLVELVGCPWDAYWNHSFLGKLLAPVMWFLTKRAVKKAPYVVYVSEKFLQKRYPSKGKTVSCSDVLLSEFNKTVLEKRMAKINRMGNEIVLGTIAAVNVKYKGQEYVIQAIKMLKQKGYNIKYRLAGGGDNEYLKNVAKKYDVSDYVEFCGSIPHDKIFDFCDELDVYIHPSVTEGLPRAMVEAMSRGCPVLGTNVGGIPELVNEKYLFKKKNPRDISEKIISMISGEELEREAMRSYERAQDFEKEKLELKRNSFYNIFKSGE